MRNRRSPMACATELLVVMLAALLAACTPNTSQELAPNLIKLRSASTPSVLTRNLSQTNPTPTNVVLLDATGVTGTDVASSVFSGFSVVKSLSIEGQPQPVDGYSVAVKIAQDADYDWAEVTVLDDNDDGNPESYHLLIKGYKGSGSKSITASVPMVQAWAEFSRALSADERDRFFRAMDTVDATFSAAVRAAAMAAGIPVPPTP